MKLDLEDGRVLTLPDEMSDESARQLKRLILVSEERAATAESHVRLMRDEMAAMRQAFKEAQASAASNDLLLAAMQKHHGEHIAALREVARVAGADRIMMADELGEYTRSRIARNGS